MIRLWTGDSLELLPMLYDNCMDSVVTDPPYETGFMAKGWDKTGIAYNVKLWTEVLRVMKPGAHLLAFGGNRTHHRMVCAIEDAGFEIRDEIDWLYGQGFPKSLNCGEGRGTALKPAKEPICVARKPMAGTVAANIIEWGTGAINIDACRVPLLNGEDISVERNGSNALDTTDAGWGFKAVSRGNEGRWPANLIHDGSDEVIAAFARTGETTSGVQRQPIGKGGIWNTIKGSAPAGPQYGDTGTPSRFYYCAKTSSTDRDEGCDFIPLTSAADMVDREAGPDGMNSPRAGADRTSGRRNNHATVKPTALMRYLCRLVTPPGGHVLDPFMGSGSTGKAAVLEGFSFTGIDLHESHTVIARSRIAWANAQGVI